MIRPVNTDDACDIARIYNRYVTDTTVSFETEPLSEEAMRQRIDSIVADGFPYFVWVENAKVVAYCYAHLWKERAAYRHTWENTIYIAPEWQGLGIGRALMGRLVDECRHRGAHALIACITAENSGSIGFHRSLGFRQVSCFEGVGEKFGRRLDVVDMQLDMELIMNEKNDAASDNMALLGSGEWMNGFAEDLSHRLVQCEELCFALNALSPSRVAERSDMIRRIFGSIGEGFTVHSPFHCDFGSNIRVGKNFVGNFNLTILDEAPVTVGDNVFVGPNVSICTVIHSFDADERNSGIMRALPVVIGDNVWIAANVVILPGVNIGAGAVVGAGSVVTKDIPAGMLAVGNPCRPVRPITGGSPVL